MDKPKMKWNKKSLWLLVGVGIAVAAVVTVVLLMNGANTGTNGFDTPYCTLQYPANEEWGNSLVLSDQTADGLYQKTFSARLGDDTYPLFTVYFGETDEGNLFGSFSDEAHTPVSIACYPLSKGHTLTPTQEMQFYAMQDGINVLTEALAKEKGFTVAN